MSKDVEWGSLPEHYWQEAGNVCSCVGCDAARICSSIYNCSGVAWKLKPNPAENKMACNIDVMNERHEEVMGAKPINDKTKYRFTPKLYKNGELDFYRLVDSLPVRPAPEVEHALKKLLFLGQRGHKDELRDLKEAKLSLEMRIDYLEGLSLC